MRAEPISLSPLFVAVLFVVVAALHVNFIGVYALGEPDEPRYAEIGREMAVGGDWVTPHLNSVQYFEKPPLVYWMTAASLSQFGMDEFGGRLPILVCGLLMAVLVFLLADRMYGRSTATLSTAIFLTAPFPAIFAEVLSLDTPLSLFMTMAWVAVWFGFDGGSVNWYRFAWAATALGVMVKGPVSAVLVVAPAAAFLLVYGGWREVRRFLDLKGIGLATAIVLPWFLLVSWRNPPFVHFFVVDQHIKRYLWTEEHGQPFWFYLVLLPVLIALWSPLSYADIGLWRRVSRPREWRRATIFLLLWIAVIVGFFSLSKSKLLPYILPAVPPMAILFGRLFDKALAEGDATFLRRGAVVLAITGVVTVVVGFALGFFIHHWRYPLIQPFLYTGGLALGLTGWLTRESARRWGTHVALHVLVAGMALTLFVGMRARVLTTTYREVSRVAASALRPGDRLASYAAFYQGLTFYTGQRVVMVNYRGELEFGSHQGDQTSHFWSNDDLRREWAKPGRILLAIKPGDLAAFQPPLDPPPIELGKEGKIVLVANR